MGTTIRGALAVVLASWTLAATARAEDAHYAGTSPDGTTVYFHTAERLVADDTDDRRDVYARDRAADTTELVSTGPAGGDGAFDADFAGVSQDGSKVFFETREALTASDTDCNPACNGDVYQRSGTTTTQVSQGPAGPGEHDAHFRAASAPDGARVFFETHSRLTTADNDGVLGEDIYERSGGTTTLLTDNTPDPDDSDPSIDVDFGGISDDGTTVFFVTQEAIVGDTDTARDVYRRSGGAVSLVSPGTAASSVSFEGNSTDGDRVFFTSFEQLAAGDTDASGDIYMREGGSVSRISTGADGGNGDFSANFTGLSDDGSRVFYETLEVLESPEDTDTQTDIYERDLGATSTSLLSTGPGGGNGAFPADFQRASSTGDRVLFTTPEKLITSGSGDDEDTVADVYQRFGTTTTRISTGTQSNGAFAATFSGASADATLVYFSTQEQVLPASDTDSRRDIYLRSGGSTSHASEGSTGGNGLFHVDFGGVSEDGVEMFFETDEQLTDDDVDGDRDVYERAVIATFLSSIEPGPPLGMPPETTISSGPSGLTNDPTPTFGFFSSEFGSTFQCRVDSGTFAACDSPRTTAPLPDGPHTFQARAIDHAGNIDGTPASATFTVDATAPQTAIDAGPSGTIDDSTPTFDFSSSEPGSTFACRFDAEPFGVCSGPGASHTAAAALADGSHTFEVVATDGAGNADPSPASASFAVDTGGAGPPPPPPGDPLADPPPDTEIAKGPRRKTGDPTPKFRLRSTDPGSSFRCKLDREPFKSCTSPMLYRRPLDLGRHVFKARAVDPAGNVDPTPAKRRFRVVEELRSQD